jgi:hypothetical protein
VGLNDLREIKNSPEFRGRGRNSDREDGIAGFCGSDQVTDRADAADARHEHRHLVEWPAFAKFLKSTKLRDVKAGRLDFSLVIGLQSDLRMAFKPRNRVNDNCASHGFS